jgi:hypothetical protein
MRKRYQKAQWVWCGYMAAFICLAFAVALVYVLVELIEDNERIQEEGVLLEGTVSDKRFNNNRGVSYYIEIEFTYEGQPLQEEEQVSKSEYDFFQVGQTLQFYYLPDANFDRVLLVGDSNLNQMICMGCMASLMFVVFLYGLSNQKR